MRIIAATIKNFRGLEDFEWQLDGQDFYLVSRNGGGKTSVLTALALACGKERTLLKTDFSDLTVPIEITATLQTTDPAEAKDFADFITFGGQKPTLTVGARGIWDGDEVETTIGFPEKGWRRLQRRDTDRLPILWVPASRDPGRLLSFALRSSVLRKSLVGGDIGSHLEAAQLAVQTAAAELAGAPPIAAVLELIAAQLARIIPNVDDHAFSVAASAQSTDELLKQLQLALSHGSGPVPLSRQSTGLAHLALFAFLLEILDSNSVAIIDEPEVSLHPQAQRSLATALRASSGQTIVATHSTAILERMDPRQLVQLTRPNQRTLIRQSGLLTDEEANSLARFATVRTAEAFFADAVVLVEGLSDELALRTLALNAGRDLDRSGITPLALDGAGSFGSYLQLLGSAGLDVTLFGLCDEDQEFEWRKHLIKSGHSAVDRDAMATSGFHVCVPDLEGALVEALGIPAVEALIAAHGRDGSLRKFERQPSNNSLARMEVIVAFIKKDKVFWAPRLVDDLDLVKREPAVLFDLLDAL